MILLRPAAWPQDVAAAQALLLRYADFLLHNPAGRVEICLSDYQDEMANLSRVYAEPQAALLLAFLADEAGGAPLPVGCVAVKVRLDRPGCAEMKRLWTEPAARGQRLGARLIEAAAWAREHGCTTLLLDTLPAAMPEALRLYRSLGFEETERHNTNPVPGLLYMKLDLG